MMRSLIVDTYKPDTESMAYSGGKIAGTVAMLAIPGPKGVGAAAVEAEGGASALGVATTEVAVAERVAVQPAAPAAKVVSKGAITADMSTGEARIAVGQALQRAESAAARVELNNYYEILRPITEANRQMVKAGVHPSKVADLSFRQADAIWVSRYGTRPPGSL
jgi:hypothetical protein